MVTLSAVVALGASVRLPGVTEIVVFPTVTVMGCVPTVGAICTGTLTETPDPISTVASPEATRLFELSKTATNTRRSTPSGTVNSARAVSLMNRKDPKIGGSMPGPVMLTSSRSPSSGTLASAS